MHSFPSGRASNLGASMSVSSGACIAASAEVHAKKSKSTHCLVAETRRPCALLLLLLQLQMLSLLQLLTLPVLQLFAARCMTKSTAAFVSLRVVWFNVCKCCWLDVDVVHNANVISQNDFPPLTSNHGLRIKLNGPRTGL